MACSKCFSRNPLPWIAAFVPFLVCTVFVGPSLLPPLFTISFVIASSLFFAFSNHKPVLVEASVEDDDPALTSDQEAQAGEGLGEVEDSTVRPPDSFSEGESVDQYSSITTDQDTEVDWSYSGGNVGRQTLEFDCSDDDDDYSISDGESLIEIALPSGHYVDPKQEESDQFNFHQKFPDFSPKSIFKQRSLMELLADINEEDNLIEIDITMGSIKCSRFEIEA